MDLGILDPKAILGAIFRTVGGLIAGYLIKRGLADGTQQDMIVGLVVGIAMFTWSTIQKMRAKKAEAEKVSLAIKAPSASTTVADIEEKHAMLKASDKPIPIV